jgi:HEPN domain-containing protein
MIDGAKTDLKISRLILSTYDDDLSVNLAAFHIQQSLEKAMKFRINMLGEIYPATHNLEHLIDILSKLGETIPAPLADEAQNINEYAVKSRYVIDFLVSKNKLNGLLTHAEDLIKSYEPVEINMAGETPNRAASCLE